MVFIIFIYEQVLEKCVVDGIVGGNLWEISKDRNDNLQLHLLIFKLNISL